jgi:putative FmdB family regulatory protein
MPLYEYECARTGKRFEVIQKFSDQPLTRCEECDQNPECEGEARRLLSAPAIQFKGAGWYVNDYAGKDKAPKADKGSSDSGDKPAKTEAPAAKSETPAAKSD